jgi:hypothetical protein
MSTDIQQPNEGGTRGESSDPLIGDAIPSVKPLPEAVKPDLSEPWYRPAKQFIRREQWNSGILHLLNRLPQSKDGSSMVLKYVGLPGQHHFDVLSMRKICVSKNVRLDYLGFRSSPDQAAGITNLDQLAAFGNTRVHTTGSGVVPDRFEHINRPNSPANNTFRDRGPFDVINLDVCGGLLHGEDLPLLEAVKFALSSQAPRQLPWLLFITTIAKPEEIAASVLKKFFATISSNCQQLEVFKNELSIAAFALGIDLESSLSDPTSLSQPTFLRLFTLALGKWLLSNLVLNSPSSLITQRASYWFRNTERDEPEMLSLAYLVTPRIVGGVDPTEITKPLSNPSNVDAEYAESAVKLISPCMAELHDLDETWDEEAVKKEVIVSDCEELLKIIGVDEAGLSEWRAVHLTGAG